MKAPDKIYVTAQRNQILGASVKPYSEGQEYVRKNALLEWANKELSIWRDSGDSDFLPAIVVLDDLIDKLNSL